MTIKNEVNIRIYINKLLQPKELIFSDSYALLRNIDTFASNAPFISILMSMLLSAF